MRQVKLWLLACCLIVLAACSNDDTPITPEKERQQTHGVRTVVEGAQRCLSLLCPYEADGTLRQLHEKYGLVYGYEFETYSQE